MGYSLKPNFRVQTKNLEQSKKFLEIAEKYGFKINPLCYNSNFLFFNHFGKATGCVDELDDFYMPNIKEISASEFYEAIIPTSIHTGLPYE